MAKYYLEEFADVPTARGGPVDAADWKSLVAFQTSEYTTEEDSTTFNAKTKYIRLRVDADSYISIGTAPNASSDDPRAFMFANEATAWEVPDNGTVKLSIVAA